MGVGGVGDGVDGVSGKMGDEGDERDELQVCCTAVYCGLKYCGGGASDRVTATTSVECDLTILRKGSQRETDQKQEGDLPLVKCDCVPQ